MPIIGSAAQSSSRTRSEINEIAQRTALGSARSLGLEQTAYRRFEGETPMRKRAIWGVGAVVVMSVLATALVLGTVPDQSGVIHGCYDKKTGLLRVID